MASKVKLTAGDVRLMRDVALAKFAQLIGPAPEQLTNLVREGLMVWHWNGGIPIYELTPAGRAHLASSGKDD